MTKRRLSVWLILILGPLFLGGLVTYLVLARSPENGGSGSRPVAQEPPVVVPLPVLGVLPEFVLTDQDGNPIGLKQLLGKAWVANFMFTRCMATCPVQSKNMAALQEKLKESSLKDHVRLVSFSVDPEFDTPKVLKEYGEHHGALRNFWYFLGGPVDDVLSLSQQGFKLPAERAGRDGKPNAAPAHSSQFVLVDQWGQIRGYYDGESAQALEDIKHDLEKVTAEHSPSAPPIAESAARRNSSQQLDDVLEDTTWLQVRQREQVEEAKRWTVFHDFGFTDRRYASGITFRHRIVDDACNLFKPNHYDHGNGVIVADVDGDGLLDIYFVSQVGSCQLWRNLGGGKFEDITAQAGVGLPDLIKATASFVDVNNDGFPDLFVTTIRGGNHLFLNDGKGHFTDVTEKSGLGQVGHYSAAVFFDYDRDGLVDLFLCEVGKYSTDTLRTVTAPVDASSPKDPKKYQYYEGFPDAFSGHLMPERSGRCLLFRNLGDGRFVDVTKEVGLDHVGCWAGDATPIDVNGDGWPGLYILNMQGNNEYYENQGGKRFVNKSREVFPKTPWGAMGVKVFDYNNDGKFDLFITDMHSDMSALVRPTKAEEKRKSEMRWPPELLATKDGTSLFGNAFYENQGGGAFKEVSDAINAENFWPWGLSVGDLNADGFQDVFITAGMSYPFRYGINSVLLNDGGKRFVDSEFVLGVEPRRGRRTAKPWFAQTIPGGKNDAGRSVTVWGSLSSRSSVIFDLDNDGDLDIVTNENNAEPMVLISNLTERKKINYLKIRLVGSMTPDGKAADHAAGDLAPGPRSNRDGLGATVRVRCGAHNYYQVNDGKSGYLSQSSLPLYFGLGEADTIDEIEVHWPTGKKQTVPGPLKSNQAITIREK